jgi:hypothetical protein
LTDLVAMVLEEHLGFANRLLQAAGLPPAKEVRATAQVTTRHGRHPDLEVVGLDRRGVPVCRLWSENKTGAEYQPDQLSDYAEDIPDQLSDYAEDIPAQPEQRQLITIVDDLSEVPRDDLSPENPRWLGFTWQQVAVMAWKAGRVESLPSDRADWRAAARKPQAPAAQRILLELLSYLEEEHNVVLNPLSHEHIAAFVYMAETGELLQAMVDETAQRVRLDLGDLADWSDEGDRLWQSFDPTGTWADRLGGWPDIEASALDDWAGERIGQPAVGAGYTFPGEVAEVLLSRQTSSWRDRVEALGFAVRASEDGNNVYVRRTKYLAELIPAGVTLDAQTRVLAEWVNEALDVLAELDPGVEAPDRPEPRRRGSRTVQTAEEQNGNPDAAAARLRKRAAQNRSQPA